MASIILAVHILVALTIVVLVLLQHGKGADMGAAFGSGSAGSLFGASGSANFLSRATGVCAAVFFITCLALTYFHAPKAGTGVMGGVTTEAPAKAEPAKKDDASSAIPAPAAPATPASPAATPAPSSVPATGETKPVQPTK